MAGRAETPPSRLVVGKAVTSKRSGSITICCDHTKKGRDKIVPNLVNVVKLKL